MAELRAISYRAQQGLTETSTGARAGPSLKTSMRRRGWDGRQRNRLVSIFVRRIREGFLGKTDASIDGVIPEETAKKASSLVQFITPNVTVPVTIIIPSPLSHHHHHH